MSPLLVKALILIQLHVLSILATTKIRFVWSDDSKSEIENHEILCLSDYQYHFDGSNPNPKTIKILKEKSMDELQKDTTKLSGLVIVPANFAQLPKLLLNSQFHESSIEVLVIILDKNELTQTKIREITPMLSNISSFPILAIFDKNYPFDKKTISSATIGFESKTATTLDISFQVPILLSNELTLPNRKQANLAELHQVFSKLSALLLLGNISPKKDQTSDVFFSNIIKSLKNSKPKEAVNIDPFHTQISHSDDIFTKENILLQTLQEADYSFTPRYNIRLQTNLFVVKYLKEAKGDAKSEYTTLKMLFCTDIEFHSFKEKICSNSTETKFLFLWNILNYCINKSSASFISQKLNPSFFVLKLYYYLIFNFDTDETNLEAQMERHLESLLQYLKYINTHSSKLDFKLLHKEVKECVSNPSESVLQDIFKIEKSIFPYLDLSYYLGLNGTSFKVTEKAAVVGQYDENDWELKLGKEIAEDEVVSNICGMGVDKDNALYCLYLHKMHETKAIIGEEGVNWTKWLEILLIIVLTVFLMAVCYLRFVNSKLMKVTYNYIQMKTTKEPARKSFATAEMFK